MMTQKEIARRLDVTQATVSLALKGAKRISPALREAVRKLAEDNCYRPNLAGQLLRGKRTNIIGAVFPRLTNPFYAQLFQEIQKELLTRGYMLCLSPADTPDEIEQTVGTLRQMRAAGVIAWGNWASKLVPLRADGIAPVLYGADQRLEAGVSQVLPDRYGAARELMAYLIGKGRRRIVFLGASTPHELRVRAYEDVMREAGLPAVKVPLDRSSHPDYMAAGFHALTALLERLPETDAVFAHNDELAIAAKRAIELSGRTVPGDVALAGFDNISAGAYLSPSLTTVEQPVKPITAALINELFASLEEPSHHVFVSIPCRLVVREST